MIKFGTSGWRGIIARDFTFDNVRLATQGIADYLKQLSTSNPQRLNHHILGYDTRFLGREFSLAAAEVLAANGLEPLLCDRDTPTPVIAHNIRHRKAIGGINMTASHNPPEYQGLKFSTSNGAPATPEVTGQIEANIVKLQAAGWSFKGAVIGTFQCRTFDPQPAYFKQLHKLIDFAALKKAKLKVAVDLSYGTGHGYLDTLLEQAGAKVTLFHNELNPLFGGHHPEPNAANMAGVSKFVRSGKAQIGLGLDGDADRFGIVDKDGTWLTPNQVLTLSLYHLKKNRGWTGAVVRTVPSSHQVDAVAELFGVKVYETPVGFKYIGALMESEPIIVGGEESGGLSVKGHVPEKDGILACLLMAELVATEKKSLGQILKELSKQIGEFLHRPHQHQLCAGEKGRVAGQARRRLAKHRPVQGGKIHHHRRLQISAAEPRMGGVPRQRHRAADSLLHRGEINGEFEKTSSRLPSVVEGMTFRGTAGEVL